ncbi:MAG: TetR/AcrR family transcriptional regulator [Actinobacteria bacterium]|nr:TetR/AcrR family transcriptional regulator [Actinomycetota bacterium]
MDGKQLTSRGEATRHRVLEAAESVFADLGYHEASIVKITEAAGVAQGTFYLYFESKQQVFDELVVDLNRRVRHAMTEGSRGASSRAEAERLGFRAFFRFTAEHPALYRVIRQAEFVSPRALHYHYSRIAAGYIANLRGAMDAGEIAEADPEALAWALMGVGELIGMRWILWNALAGGDAPSPDPSDPVPDEVLDTIFEFISRGLGAGS